MNPGDKVTYVPKFGPKEIGIVKALATGFVQGDGWARVVYKCGGDWEHYENYTGELTDIHDLQPGWPKEEEKKSKMNPYEQKAQALAAVVANEIFQYAPNRTSAQEIILRELNLAKLLEYAAMLDWLSKENHADLLHCDGEGEGHYIESFEMETQPDVRTAIRNAMQSKEDGK